jgi:hypothetical protein
MTFIRPKNVLLWLIFALFGSHFSFLFGTVLTVPCHLIMFIALPKSQFFSFHICLPLYCHNVHIVYLLIQLFHLFNSTILFCIAMIPLFCPLQRSGCYIQSIYISFPLFMAFYYYFSFVISLKWFDMLSLAFYYCFPCVISLK